MIKKTILNKIINFFDPDYIYIVGSSLCVTSPKDIDIVVIFNSNDEYSKSFSKYNANQELISILHDSSNPIQYNLLFDYTDRIDATMLEYSYESNKNHTLLYSKNNDDIYSKYDLINNKTYREKVLQKLKTQIINHELPNTDIRAFSYFKKPYRFLLTCYILNNNSYDISEEQLKIVNNVHDSGILSDELFNWCSNVVQNLIDKEGICA